MSIIINVVGKSSPEPEPEQQQQAVSEEQLSAVYWIRLGKLRRRYGKFAESYLTTIQK